MFETALLFNLEDNPTKMGTPSIFDTSREVQKLKILLQNLKILPHQFYTNFKIMSNKSPPLSEH